jgi:hypothetical protein
MAFRSLLCKKLGYCSKLVSWSKSYQCKLRKLQLSSDFRDKRMEKRLLVVKVESLETLVLAEQEGDYQLYFTKSATAGEILL